MPGVLYQGENVEGSLGVSSSEQLQIHRYSPCPKSAMDGDISHSPCASLSQKDGANEPHHSQEEGGIPVGRSYRSMTVTMGVSHKTGSTHFEGRRMSLSRGELLTERRLSLQPAQIFMRGRSRSQPPEKAHSESPPSGEYLAGMALQSALVPCVLPTIRISQDVSQGESNVEDGLQPPRLSPHDDARTRSSSKSPSRIASKLPSTPSSPSSPSSTLPILSYQISASPPETNHDLPTDLSDTAESEHEKEKLPGSSPETVVCPNITTHHAGREVSNAVYGLPIDTLFTLLFTNSTFMLDLHASRKTYDVVASPWQSNPETNQKIRQVTYTLTLPTNSFGPKVSHVTETQVISSFSKPSEIYTVDAEASNSGIPYADSFYVSNHWCLTRESANETRLIVWSQVKYKKNVWGFMKSVIDKNACSGMEGLISDLNASLLLEVDRMNLKRTKRRRRRAGSKGGEIGDSNLQITAPGVKLSDIHKSTQIPSRKAKAEVPPVNSSIKTIALIVLCALLALNAFLYYRLYDLEERIVNNVSFKNLDAALFKFSGSSSDETVPEEWVQILHQQESLHTQELERWRTAVMEAADYLRMAEESLRNLHSSIPSKQASKMQALLQQLQLLKEMQEQKSHPPPTKPSVFPEGMENEPTPGKTGEPPPHAKLEL